MKLLPLAAMLPLAFVGCTSTNPKAAFDDVGKHVSVRTGQEVRWMHDDATRDEIEKAVETLLQTNLTAQSAVAIALLNNRALQAEFETIGVSQAELAQAARLRNPQFSGLWRFPTQGSTVVNAEYSLAQEFLDLLTLPARKKIAARNLEATKLRVAHEVLNLANETQAAFYTVQARYQLTNRLAILVEVNEAAADISKRQHDAGNITDLELQNQQAAYAQSDSILLAHRRKSAPTASGSIARLAYGASRRRGKWPTNFQHFPRRNCRSKILKPSLLVADSTLARHAGNWLMCLPRSS